MVTDEMPEMMSDFTLKISIPSILAFITGAASRPVMGFTPRPGITFIHDTARSTPSSSTCSNELKLMVNPNMMDCGKFAFAFITSMMNGTVFSTI